jgi:hypothetical protein
VGVGEAEAPGTETSATLATTWKPMLSLWAPALEAGPDPHTATTTKTILSA